MIVPSFAQIDPTFFGGGRNGKTTLAQGFCATVPTVPTYNIYIKSNVGRWEVCAAPARKVRRKWWEQGTVSLKPAEIRQKNRSKLAGTDGTARLER